MTPYDPEVREFNIVRRIDRRQPTDDERTSALGVRWTYFPKSGALRTRKTGRPTMEQHTLRLRLTPILPCGLPAS